MVNAILAGLEGLGLDIDEMSDPQVLFERALDRIIAGIAATLPAA